MTDTAASRKISCKIRKHDELQELQEWEKWSNSRIYEAVRAVERVESRTASVVADAAAAGKLYRCRSKQKMEEVESWGTNVDGEVHITVDKRLKSLLYSRGYMLGQFYQQAAAILEIEIAKGQSVQDALKTCHSEYLSQQIFPF